MKTLVCSILIRIDKKIFHVVDDSDVKRATRAASYLLAKLEIFLCDLEQIPTWTRICVRLQLLIPLHVFDFYVIIRHCFVVIWSALNKQQINSKKTQVEVETISIRVKTNTKFLN